MGSLDSLRPSSSERSIHCFGHAAVKFPWAILGDCLAEASISGSVAQGGARPGAEIWKVGQQLKGQMR